jgi:methylenetetrahydrofolate dehydrogenase (NADP+) / methenyltetrahydrofolate cyclohydrolase
LILLDGQKVSETIKEGLKKEAKAFELLAGRPAGLAVILVGNAPPSVLYTRRKAGLAEQLGIRSLRLEFPENTAKQVLEEAVEELNQDPTIDGILIQRPLPFEATEVHTWVDFMKDVDGFHPHNVAARVLGEEGLFPCTPLGILRLLDVYKIPLEGKTICVMGRSHLVGLPLAHLSLQRDATVIQCHRKTRDLKALTCMSDICVLATDQPEWFDDTYIRDGTVVVDVGIHNLNGRITGNALQSSLYRKAFALSPVPGGVGPMTLVLLMENTLKAARARLNHPA